MSIDAEALKQRLDIVAVIGAHVPLKKRGAEYLGLCPFHDDSDPSLHVVPAKQIFKCFACNEGGDVIDFIAKHQGLDFKGACEYLGAKDEWKPTKPIKQEAKQPERITSKPPPDAPSPKFSTPKLGEPERVFPLLDSDGATLGYEARYKGPDGKKVILMWTWGAKASAPPAWGMGAFNKLRPLYGLQHLAERPEAPVSIFEGPKKAEAGRELLPMYACISWTGGANAWPYHEWGPVRGRNVLIWPDADEPGREAAQKLAAMLSDPKGLACRKVRIVDTSGMKESWDVADALDDGWKPEDLLTWAKGRPKEYTPVSQAPAPDVDTASDGAPPAATPEAGALSDPPAAPPAEPIPLDAYREEPAAQPKKRKRARLSVVSGNTAQEVEAEQLPVEMSEDALADHFAAEHGKDWRYVSRWGRWFKWGGDVWREDETEEVFHLARDICRAAVYWPEAASLTPDGRRKIARKATAGNVRDMAGSDRRIAATTDQWDRDPFLLGVPGGVVDLKTGELLIGEPDQYITKKCSVRPEAGPHPLFDMVLARACADDPDMQPYLMRFFGYILTGDVREECFLFLHGPGGSGKGTLVKCVADILGDYAKTISMEALVESKTQRHPQELAKLDRARFVYASETEEGRRWNESLIKWLTGRDKITAHFMRENDFEFYPQFKLLIYGNHIPHLKSVGEEMRRRVHLIEYAGSIAEEDRDTELKDRLVAEYPAILHTLISGCIEWQDMGLGKPERVSAATSSYLESEDTLGIWLEDNIMRDPHAKTQSGDVYRDFKRWAESAGEYVMSQKRFVQTMRQRGFDTKRVGGKRFIDGLSLKTPPDYSQPGRYQDD